MGLAGRPIKEEKSESREYYRKSYQFAFASLEERDNFDNKIKNLKYKLNTTRQDVIIMMGLELLEEKVKSRRGIDE